MMPTPITIAALLTGKKASISKRLRTFDKAIELNPDIADAYNNRGIAYAGKGEFERAIADYDKAIKFKPDVADAYNNRGNAHSDKGEYKRAIADLIRQ